MLGDAKSPCNLLVAGVHSSTRTRLHFEAGKNVESQKDKAVCDLSLCSWVNVCACVCICVYSLCVTCARASRLQRARGASVRSRRPAWLRASRFVLRLRCCPRQHWPPSALAVGQAEAGVNRYLIDLHRQLPPCIPSESVSFQTAFGLWSSAGSNGLV